MIRLLFQMLILQCLLLSVPESVPGTTGRETTTSAASSTDVEFYCSRITDSFCLANGYEKKIAFHRSKDALDPPTAPLWNYRKTFSPPPNLSE